MWRFDSSSQKSVVNIAVVIIDVVLKKLFYKKYLIEVGLKKYIFG